MKKTLIAIALLCAAVLALTPITAFADTQNVVKGVYQLGGNTFIDTYDGAYVTKDMVNFKELGYEWLSYVNGILFARANGSEYIVYSRDGVKFTPITTDWKQGNIDNIIYFKNHYLAFCDIGVAGSGNGAEWAVCAKIDGYGWFGTRFVYKDNLFFIAYEDNYDNGNLYLTSDAVTYAKITGFEEMYGEIDVLYNDTFVITRKESGESPDGSTLYTYYVSNDMKNYRVLQLDGKPLEKSEWISWSWISEDWKGQTLSNALPGSKPIKVDNIAGDKMLSSYAFYEKFGEKVQVSTPITKFSAAGKKYTFAGSNAGGDYVGGANIGGAIYSEKFEWVMGDFNFQDAASNGKGQFIITGDHGAMLVCTLTKNSDKYEMTAAAHAFNPDGSGIHMLKYTNGRYFLGTFSGGLYCSANGLDWVGFAAMTSPINDIMFANKCYYAACDDGVYSSTDGKKWTRVYQTTSELLSLAYGNNKIIACGENATIISGSIANSKTVWKRSETESTYDTYHSVAFGNNVWIIGGGSGWGGSGVMLRSVDGITWTPVHDGEEGFEVNTNSDICYRNCPYVMKYIGGHFVAGGLDRRSDSCILTGSADGLEWTERDIHYWGLDVFEPLPGVAAVINSYGIYIDGEHFDTGGVALNPNSYTKIMPTNTITPLFSMPEEISASSKK